MPPRQSQKDFQGHAIFIFMFVDFGQTPFTFIEYVLKMKSMRNSVISKISMNEHSQPFTIRQCYKVYEHELMQPIRSVILRQGELKYPVQGSHFHGKPQMNDSAWTNFRP